MGYVQGDTERIVNALLLVERQLRRIADKLDAPDVVMATDEVAARQLVEAREWASRQPGWNE